MKKKDGVILPNKLIMCQAMAVAENAYRDSNVEFIITSGMEGTHSAMSYHPSGYAFDCRTKHMVSKTGVRLTKLIREIWLKIRDDLKSVSQFFDVILEKTHIHIEFDYRRFCIHYGRLGLL